MWSTDHLHSVIMRADPMAKNLLVITSNMLQMHSDVDHPFKVLELQDNQSGITLWYNPTPARTAGRKLHELHGPDPFPDVRFRARYSFILTSRCKRETWLSSLWVFVKPSSIFVRNTGNQAEEFAGRGHRTLYMALLYTGSWLAQEAMVETFNKLIHFGI